VAQLAGGSLEQAANGALGLAKKFITGSGDYELSEITPDVSANSLIHPTLAESVPMFGAESGHVMIAHREYIGDIVIPPTFAERPFTFVINPGDAATFPWLNRTAVNFEQYRLVGCLFEFISTSTASTVNPNPALWTISMATQYNVNSRVFGSKRQVLNHFFSSSGVAASNVIHAIECREELTAVTPKYVRHADIDPILISDARMLDVGRLTVWASGGAVQAVPITLGELHVTFQIALMKPRLQILPGGTTYDAPDDAIPDPDQELVHLPELQTLCISEVSSLRARLAALEDHEYKDSMSEPELVARAR